MSERARDLPVLMSRQLVALSAMLTSCAALSLLSGSLYVGCSGGSRPSHLPPSASQLASQGPTSPADPATPTTQLPQAQSLPSQAAPVSALAVPVHLQGPSVAQALTQNDSEVLAALALTTSNPPQVRYTALRRLEQVDPARAAEVAYELARDPATIVATNALAVLVRQGDPRIGSLDPRSQRLAAALASQG